MRLFIFYKELFGHKATKKREGNKQGQAEDDKPQWVGGDEQDINQSAKQQYKSGNQGQRFALANGSAGKSCNKRADE